MNKKTVLACLSLGYLAFLPGSGWALGVSHHGGMILDCTPPMFFDESPGKDAKVASFQTFSLAASDNTDQDTVNVWVNNQPVAVEISPTRSGRLAITGSLPQPITSGRIWMKVTAYSHDGCDQLHTWYVHAGQ